MEHQGLGQIDISESWERLVATDPTLLDCAVLHTDPEDVRVAAALRKQRRERGVGPGRLGQRLPPMVEWEATLGVWAVTWKSLGGEASVVPKPGWEAVVQEQASACEVGPLSVEGRADGRVVASCGPPGQTPRGRSSERY